MHATSKKTLSILMSIVLVLGLMPLPAYAESGAGAAKDAATSAGAPAENSLYVEGAVDGRASDEFAVMDSSATSVGRDVPYPDRANAEVIASGSFGENEALSWEYWNDATLVVGGTGAMPDFDDGTQPWNARLGEIEHVVVGEGVTAIGNWAFYGSGLNTYVSLPDSLLRIGAHAFDSNSLLEQITLPDSIREMGEYAFYQNSSLKSIVLPASLIEVPDHAFDYCTSLSGSLVIPEGVSRVGDLAFAYSGGINALTLNSGLKTIGTRAFMACTLTDLTIPGTVTTIGYSAFGHISNNLIFEEGITSLGFNNEEAMFKDAFPTTGSFPKMHIPASVTDIPQRFNSRSSYFTVDEGNPYFASSGGMLLSHKSGEGEYVSDVKTDVLYKVPMTAKGTVSIPDGVKIVDNGVFFGSAVTGISLPASVEAIYPDSNYEGYVYGQTENEVHGIFDDLTNLVSIEVGDANAHFTVKDGVLFSKDMTTLWIAPKPIIGSYRMPETVTRVEQHAFKHTGALTEVLYSPNLEGADNYCDAYGDKVANYYIPKAIEEIDLNVYSTKSYNAKQLPENCNVSIFFEGSEEQLDKACKLVASQSSINEMNTFCNVVHYGKCGEGLQYCIDSRGVLTILPDGSVDGESQRAMKNFDEGAAPWKEHATEITSVVVMDHVATIGDNAFSHCENLEKVEVAATVTAVGKKSFASCPKLTDVFFAGDVVSANGVDDPDASFDATTTVRYASGNETWSSDEGYDASTGKWRGYLLSAYDALGLPELKSVQMTYESLERGYPQNPNIPIFEGSRSYRFYFYSTAGEDISEKVSVTIERPDEEPFTDDYVARFRMRSMSGGYPLRHLEYNGKTHILETGGCNPAGTYYLTATPKAGEAIGAPLRYQFTIHRTPERVSNWQNENPVIVRGGIDEYVDGCSPRIYNQFGDEITADLSMRIIDAMNGEDITDKLSDYGLQVEGKTIRVHSKAQPRKYKLVLEDATNGREGKAEPTFEVLRDENIINKAYSLALSGGEREIILGENGVWASVPYRTLINDAYGDPCWPSVEWTVFKGSEDVSTYFTVDEQGYIYVKPEAASIIASEGTEFEIHAKAYGVQTSYPYRQRVVEDSATFIVKPLQSDPAPKTHIATFKAGDQVVGTVVFEEGAATLEEPAVPARDNYMGAWEQYDLAAATGDITVNAVYTPVDPDAVSEVGGESGAEYKDGAVRVSLSASAATRQVKVESEQTKPVDVVMVLDQSGSMADSLGAGQSKRDALVECAGGFAQKLFENAKKTGAEHRVALVGFAYSAYNNGKYKNTGLLAGMGGAKGYATLTQADYAGALLPVAQGDALNPAVSAGISSIVADGATAADVGLKIAKNVFAANPAAAGEGGAERERVVVFITDGVPTSWGQESALVRETAAEAITMANTIKQGQGAKVYSVGVDAAANPAAAFNDVPDGVIVGPRDSYRGYDFNRFLHAVSSNYPEASSMASLGAGGWGGGYYMAVNDTSSLSKMFDTVMYSTVYSIESFDRATLTYVLPEGFELTMKQEEAMRAALAGRGLSDDDIVVAVRDGKTNVTFKNVPVEAETGGDGAVRYVARVEFDISPGKDVSGRVQVGAGSSVEVGGEAIEVGGSTVDVPADRCLVVFKVNDAVYEIREVQMGDEIAVPETDLARWLELEKLQEQGAAVADSAYAVFETSTLTREYNLTWVVGEHSATRSSKPGVAIEVPADVLAWVPEGNEVASWSPTLPATMPARDITCTAVLTPKHVHDFSHSTYRTGKCTEGIATHHVCACGEEGPADTAAPHKHSFEAVLSGAGQYGSTVEKLVCAECGHTEDKNITYTVSRSSFWNTTVLDLTKLVNEVVVDGESSDAISLRFYVGGGNQSYKVTRIDADGARTDYTTRLQDGYLVFDPNHFSIYVLGEVAEDGASTSDDIGYADCQDVIANPDLPTVMGEPEGAAAVETSGLESKLGEAKAKVADQSVRVLADGTAAASVAKGQRFVWRSERAALDSAITAAQAVLDGGQLVQADVDEAMSALENAVSGYVVKVGAKEAPQQAAAGPSSSAKAASKAMHRLYNPYSGEHFYTGDANEKGHLVSLGWSYEGVGWNAPTSGKDVHRLYNRFSGDHHFTLDAHEKDVLVSLGWTYEGVGWRSGGTVKVYREYNPYASAFYHNYTKDANEHRTLCSIGWKDEGVGWYGV